MSRRDYAPASVTGFDLTESDLKLERLARAHWWARQQDQFDAGDRLKIIQGERSEAIEDAWTAVCGDEMDAMCIALRTVTLLDLL